jgi:hypothetical protein
MEEAFRLSAGYGTAFIPVDLIFSAADSNEPKSYATTE